MPEPDEAQQSEPVKKATAMQVAERALDLATALDVVLDDTVKPQLTDLSRRLTEATTPAVGGNSVSLADIQDQVAIFVQESDRRFGEREKTFDALVSEVRGVLANSTPEPGSLARSLDPIMARLEAAEQKAARAEDGPRQDCVAFGAALERMSERIRQLESDRKSDPDAAAITLEEDALSDRVDDLVRDHLVGLTKRLAAIEEDKYASELGERLTLLEEQRRRDLDARVTSAGTVHHLDATSSVGGVYAKVLELMRLVPAIGKNKQADQGAGGRFKFRGIDDAMDAVGHGMREIGLVLETVVVSADRTQNQVTNAAYNRQGERDGEKTVTWTTSTVVYEYTFIDPVDGSRQRFQMAGEGRDASDKSTSKAGSMALKYGLFQALMVPVTGLDDSDTEQPEIAQRRPQETAKPPAQTPPAAAAPADKPASASVMQRAHDAKKAYDNLGHVPFAQRRATWQAITNQAKTEGLGDVVVDGASVSHWARAAGQTLPAEQPAADPREASTDLVEPPEDYR